MGDEIGIRLAAAAEAYREYQLTGERRTELRARLEIVAERTALLTSG